MSHRDREQMWITLQRLHLVEGTLPAARELESPWYVKILLAVSGWIASLFLLGFLAMAWTAIVDNETVAFFAGAILIAISYAILRTPKNEFVEHLALAISLAGQALAVYGIFSFTGEHNSQSWLWLVLMEAALVAVMPNFIHRVFSSFVAGLAFFIGLFLSGWSLGAGGALMVGVAWCWLNEFSYPKQMRAIQAVGYGLILSLITLKSMELSGYRAIDWLGYYQVRTLALPWVGELLTSAAVLYVVWELLRRYKLPISGLPALLALAGSVAVCGLSLEVHGLTVGMMLIVLGFSCSNRLLLGLGIVSLVALISSYYYLLEQTLLVKSCSLFATGLTLLILRWCMVHVLPEKKEEKHV